MEQESKLVMLQAQYDKLFANFSRLSNIHDKLLVDNKDFSLYKHASTAQIAELKKSEEEMERAKEARLMKISNVFDELE